MSPDDRMQTDAGSPSPANDDGVAATQPTGMSGLDSVADDLTYDEDASNAGVELIDPAVETSTYSDSAPVEMRAGYSQSGSTTADRVAGGSIDETTDGPFADESMFSTDDDGTPSADDQIGAMSRDEDGGGGILSGTD